MNDKLNDHMIVAVFYQRGASGIYHPYSIWRIDQMGRPTGLWTTDSTWSAATTDDYYRGYLTPGPQTYPRRSDAVKEARRAAKLSGLAVDVNDRLYSDLFGPRQACAICRAELPTRGWEPGICKDCQVIHEHGLRALGDKQAYMVGPHPGNGRAREGAKYLYPLAELLASLAGTVPREKRKTSVPGKPYAAHQTENPGQTVGYRKPDSYWGGDMVVDLTPAQAAAWTAAVEWIQAEIDRTQRAALDQGTRLLTGLASGRLAPEDFEPQVIQLRRGQPLR